MLDLNQAADQLVDLAGQVALWHRGLPDRQARMREQLAHAAALPVLPAVEERAARWTARLESEPLALRDPAGVPPDRATVIAVDGSQIEPDFHEMVGCCLVNVGWAIFQFGGATGRAELGSKPTVELIGGLTAAGEGSPDGEGGSGRTSIARARGTELRRMRLEVEQLRTLLAAVDREPPAVALLDGPLIAYWVLNLLEEADRQAMIAAYRALFAEARNGGAVVAGYISRSRAMEVMNLLRYLACGGVADGGPLCGVCRDAFPRAVAGEGVAACYAGLDGVLDRHLFCDLLQVGERSACFRSPGSSSAAVAGAQIGLRFFYLRSRDDLARVEVPNWVADDPEQLRRFHAVLLDQIELGQGYPLALSEAHEQAVVRGPDRSAFWQLLNRCCARAGIVEDWSPKLRAKRQAVG